jgi:hypothetical protein
VTASPEQSKAKEKKWRRVQKMWASNLSQAEIAKRMNWSTGHVKIEISRMRLAGWDVPKRTQTRVRPTECVICSGPLEGDRSTCGDACLSELGRRNAAKRHGRQRGR